MMPELETSATSDTRSVVAVAEGMGCCCCASARSVVADAGVADVADVADINGVTDGLHVADVVDFTDFAEGDISDASLLSLLLKQLQPRPRRVVVAAAEEAIEAVNQLLSKN